MKTNSNYKPLLLGVLFIGATAISHADRVSWATVDAQLQTTYNEILAKCSPQQLDKPKLLTYVKTLEDNWIGAKIELCHGDIDASTTNEALFDCHQDWDKDQQNVLNDIDGSF